MVEQDIGREGGVTPAAPGRSMVVSDWRAMGPPPCPRLNFNKEQLTLELIH